MRGAAALAVALLALAGGPGAAEPPAPAPAKGPVAEATELVNTVLGALLGAGEVTPARLQREVEEAGGLPFRRDVPVAFLSPQELSGYLRELFDAEYPPEVALVDERLLRAFDLLPEGTDLRAVRARVLEDNVAGFYDERPDRRRLYAVSAERAFTPMNQVVLAHELRHALQDQYEELHDALPGDVSDFDDRRLAWLCLLEGDATLVMERFVRLRLGAPEASSVGGAGTAQAFDTAGLLDVPGAPEVVRDHLVEPYVAGAAFARAVWDRGGPQGMRAAWARPPDSTEQVLHPAKYFEREAPRAVEPPALPRGSRRLSEGVLGELLLRSLLGRGAEAAAAGWGGDAWRLADTGRGTALAWRSAWDTERDAVEFEESLRARFAGRHGPAAVRGVAAVFQTGSGFRFAIRRRGTSVDLASTDDAAAFEWLARVTH